MELRHVCMKSVNGDEILESSKTQSGTQRKFLSEYNHSRYDHKAQIVCILWKSRFEGHQNMLFSKSELV
jgi:hypothetical protein